MPHRDPPGRKISPKFTEGAIEELKRRGKAQWGATYYSQLAPAELCEAAGRARRVQYGALISWLKRLSEDARPDPTGAIALVAHLMNTTPDDLELINSVPSVETPPRARPPERAPVREGRFEVNCPSVVHDYRFVLVGELPQDHLYPLVLVQPLDGTGYWYPQMARHNPLRAGRAFACFVQLGNPNGIWHVRRPPLDAKVRVYALERAFAGETILRLSEDELAHRVDELGVVAQRDSYTSRVSIDPLAPELRDGGDFGAEPLTFDLARVHSCVAPLRLDWQGGAAYVEIREGSGDRLVFQGTAAPGVSLTLRGRANADSAVPVLYELGAPGRYRVRLYPAAKSFLDPPYEWWLEVR